MLPSGARKWTQALPLSSSPDSKRIATPADRSSAVAAWTSSTRNPATGPVVKCRLISVSGPKTSTLLPSGSLSIQNPGCSSSSRRPRTSRKKATVGSALSVRVPTQASLMIRMARRVPPSRTRQPQPKARVRAPAAWLWGSSDYRSSGALGVRMMVRVSDDTAVGVGRADICVRGPIGLHRSDRGPWGRAGGRSCRRVLWGGAPAAGRPSGPGGQDHRDAVMLRSADAAAAIRLGLCIVHDVGAQHGFPLVRVGMHTGPAVEREGDWFGATVNLAARVSAAAAGGEALLTAATRDAAGQLEGMELRERGRWTFRNVTEPVPVYAAVRQGARSSAGLPIDPVCRMAVDPWHSAGRLTHEGVEYCFCSLGCAGAFARHPARYAAGDGTG